MADTSAVPGVAEPGLARPGDPGPAGVTPAPPATSWPGPNVPFFPAGYRPLAADFYGWWYLNALFHQRKVVFRARQIASTTTIHDDGNPHVIGYDTVDEDPSGGWDGGAFAWTPKISGFYQVTVTIFTAALVAGSMIRPAIAGTYVKNLACQQGSTSHPSGVEGQWEVYLIGGATTVQGAAWYLSAGAPVATSDTPGMNSSMEIMWLGT